MLRNIQALDQEHVCYLTTKGRVSGQSHTIEIWFALYENTVYLLAGSREKADWVKNIMKDGQVTVKIKDETFTGYGSLVTDEDEDVLARRVISEKYVGDDPELVQWSRAALPVAIDIS